MNQAILLEFPENLPVVAHKDAIEKALAAHQVVIICGETGSGKTTQLPKICLAAGREGLIGHTQPRRIAARSVAARIAEELKTPLGGTVGFKVRFHDVTGQDCRIKLMTDGILLAETAGDPHLARYGTLIIDEAHERSLNIDFLLGYLRKLLKKRRELKLVVTSATIDAARFSRHFFDAPVIEVSGRGFPVEIRYRPVPDEEDPEAAILAAVGEASLTHPGGDMLVFLPGEREIRSLAEALRKHHPIDTEILPLYSRLSVAEQDRVFRPGKSRRIVLATNVAETSLTVPNIGVVIDPGFARINRYSFRNKVEQLLLEKISRASANQRAGRSGRVMAGLCIRLYSEEDYLLRPEYTDPEILRSSLAAVILKMKSLKIGDVEDFPFLDRPAPRMIVDGYQLLSELGAVDEKRNLTVLGGRLAKLPIDPRIGRMLLAAKDENCLSEVLIIASALSVQDPRERPADHQEAADAAHRLFADERSEFLFFLKLWAFFNEANESLSSRKLAAECRSRFLSLPRMREWRELHGQIQAILLEMGMKPNTVPASYQEIHTALLSGLLGNIGFKDEEGGYNGARGIKFRIFPGTLQKKKPKWLLAADILETTRLYARVTAEIQPEWIEKVGAHLLKKSYFEPHWEKSRGQVVAYEQSTLYGLIINPKRRIHYGPIDPVLSRELFIRQALVGGEYSGSARFFAHNRELIREVEEIEHKSRRSDVLVDDESLYSFYAERIPKNIFQLATFERWLKEGKNGDSLFLSREYLMKHGAESVTEERFPANLVIDGVALALSYRFEPAHVMDGVTVTLPVFLLNRFSQEKFDWLVPGLQREKIGWLLKSLPKNFRNKLFPVNEYVDACLDGDRSQPLIPAMSAALRRKSGLQIPSDAWNFQDMPMHLRMNFRIVDEKGDEIGMGRDLSALQKKFGDRAEADFAAKSEFERRGITRWDFGDLPEKVELEGGIEGFPAIVDEGKSVMLALFETAQKAKEKHLNGLLRLYSFELKAQLDQIKIPQSLQLFYLGKGGVAEFRERFLFLLLRALCRETRTEDEFRAGLQTAKAELPVLARDAAKLLEEILASSKALEKRLATPPPAFATAYADMKEQLANLVQPEVLFAADFDRLKCYPRYLKAIALRIEKLPGAMQRDREAQTEVEKRWRAYVARRQQAGASAALEEYRWLLEELRVSLFAEVLRTPFPVSTKRLDKFWESLGK